MSKCNSCGREFKNGRALHAHQKFHCTGNAGESQRTGQPKPAQRKKEVIECDVYGSHEWQLLRPVSAAHQNAIRDGYRKICECGELA